VFNLAVLLGLGAVVAGGIELHRRVIVMEGAVAMVIAAVCLSVVRGGPGPGAGLLVHHVAEIVIRGLVLAGVTSLPQCRRLPLYLAGRGWDAAHARHRPQQQRPERHRRLAAPGILVAGRATGTGDLSPPGISGLTAVTLACAYAVAGSVEPTAC